MTGPDRSDLLTRLAAEVLPVPVSARVAGENARNLVVEVVAEDGRRWFAKHFRRQSGFASEVGAHRRFLAPVAGRVPRLVHHDDRLQCTVTTAVPGSLHQRPDRAVFVSAGRFLADLQATSPLRWRVAESDLDDKLRRVLRQGRVLGIRIDRRWLRSAVRRADGAAVPFAVTHGDYRPRNWLVDQDGTLRVIDFEHTGERPAVHDLARLAYAVGGLDPWQLAAALEGYARALDEAEHRYLEAQLALMAVDEMVRGAWLGRQPRLEHGRRMAARLGARTGAA